MSDSGTNQPTDDTNRVTDGDRGNKPRHAEHLQADRAGRRATCDGALNRLGVTRLKMRERLIELGLHPARGAGGANDEDLTLDINIS